MGITIAAWFTSTIYDDDFTLVVKKASEVNIMERVARPFTKTLTPGAWSMVIGTMFAVSLAMVVVEGADNVGDGIDRVMRKLNADEAALSKAGVLPGSGEEGGDEDPMDDDDSNREGGGWSVFYGFMGKPSLNAKHPHLIGFFFELRL